MPIRLAHAQSGAVSADLPAVGLHDSINVASLEFAGAHAVTPAELKLVVFTRTSSCRLILLAALCNVAPASIVDPARVEVIFIGGAHALFVLRLFVARQAASRQRAIDLARFQEMKGA